MTGLGLATLVASMAVAAALALLARPRGPSTLDFYLAGQRIGVAANASAICGDYFSAASFLGVAAAVYSAGLDGVWYATGFAAGFVPVALFFAAPLRRFGEFSLPDVLGRRLESGTVRLVAVAVVQLVIVSYLVPQAVGSGITWELLVGKGFAGLSPYATGVVLSTAVIALITGLGGMRGTTWTQAVQFLFLMAVLLWLTVVAVTHGFSYPEAVSRISAEPLRNPVLTDSGWALRTVENRVTGGAASFDRPGARYGALDQFALVVTLMLGTAGLPHVMNRFFTSPTGRAARLTTVWVLGAAGLFYAMAVLLGVAARAAIPDAVGEHPWLEPLTVEGLLRVPEHALLALGRVYGGQVGLGVIAVGALVAVMSTIAGLLLASAASWGHDLYERHINPRATQSQAVWAGRIAVWVVATFAAAAAMALEPVSLSGLFPSIVATMVTWAFALAGSSLTPVLLLTIWWRGTTAAGATAGLAVGAAVSIGMFTVGLATVDARVQGLLLAPALVGAPVAGVVTVLVSLRTRLPASLDASWVRLHGTASDRRAERLAKLTIRGLSTREGRR